MKSKTDIQKINFDVPVSYGNAKKLQTSTRELPNWDERARASKSFNLGWKKILGKISSREDLTKRELRKALVYFDSIPEELTANLKFILINFTREDALTPIIDQLNRKYFNIMPIRFLLDEKLTNKFGEQYFLKGLVKFKAQIKQSGWQGLLLAINDSSSSFELIKNDFYSSDTPELFSESFGKLIEGLVECDWKANLFTHNVLDYISTLKDFGAKHTDLMENFDRYLGFYLDIDHSWEGKVISDDYIVVKLMNYFLREFNINSSQLPVNALKVFNQRKNLEKAIDLLNKQEPDRGNFWKKYMPFASRVMHQKSFSTVAVAFFFKNIVIVEFAPAGNAAYVYKRDIFEKYLLNSKTVMGWKRKEYTHKIRYFTRNDGTLYHIRNWQNDFSRILDTIVRKT